MNEYESRWRHDRLVEERAKGITLLLLVCAVSLAVAGVVLSWGEAWAAGIFVGAVIMVAAFVKPELTLLFVILLAPLVAVAQVPGQGALPFGGLPMQEFGSLIPGTGLTPLNTLIVFLLIGAWAHRFSTNPPAAQATEVDKPLLLFLAWSGLAVFTSMAFYYFDSQSVGEWIGFACGYVIFWIVRRRWKARGLIPVALFLMMGMLAYESALVIYQFQALNVSAFDWQLKRIISGTFPSGNSNEIATFLSTYSLVALGLFIALRNSVWRLPLLGVFLAAGGATFLTYSRGAMIGLMMGAVFMTMYKHRRFFVPILLLMLLLPSVLPASVVGHLTTTDSSTESRKEVWKRAAVVTLKNPLFGVGWRGYGKNQMYQGFKLKDPHNMFLLVSAEQGIPGLVLFVGVLLGAARLITQTLSRKRPAFTEGLALGLFGALVCLAVNSVFGSRMVFPYTVMYFWIMLGLLAVLARPSATGEEPPTALLEPEEPEKVPAVSPWRYKSYV